MGLALAAGGCWAIYIVMGQHTAALPGHQAVAVGMALAALPVVPFGIAGGNCRR